MAGFLDAQMLNNFALAGATLAVEDKTVSFEEDPSGYYQSLLIYISNTNFLQPMIERHPSFSPVAEKFLRAYKAYFGHDENNDCYRFLDLMGIYLDLFSDSMELYETETYQYDVIFNIMLAAILSLACDCGKDIEERFSNISGTFFCMIEQCNDIKKMISGEMLQQNGGIVPSLLMACALWGADYEGFRAISTNKYYELKAERSGSKITIPNGGAVQQTGRNPQAQQAQQVQAKRQHEQQIQRELEESAREKTRRILKILSFAWAPFTAIAFLALGNIGGLVEIIIIVAIIAFCWSRVER